MDLLVRIDLILTGSAETLNEYKGDSALKTKTSAGLKALPLWQAILYPIAFALMGSIISIRERYLMKWLPKRKLAPYTYVPRENYETPDALTLLTVDELDLEYLFEKPAEEAGGKTRAISSPGNNIRNR